MGRLSDIKASLGKISDDAASRDEKVSDNLMETIGHTDTVHDRSLSASDKLSDNSGHKPISVDWTDTVDRKRNRPITAPTVLEAMRMFSEHQGTYDEWKSKLEEKGYAWSIDEAKDYMQRHPDHASSFGEGFATGDTSHGAIFVANSCAGRDNYSFCNERKPYASEYVKAATKKLEAELGIQSSEPDTGFDFGE